MPKPSQPFAAIDWERGEIPVSTAFGDPYFARENGRAETRHVFLAANGLPQRWQARAAFTIAELGFGTGLNFFETLAQWRRAPGNCRALTYVTFERYPLAGCDLARALAPWPDLEGDVRALLDHWPPVAGATQHTVAFNDATLDIRIGDANALLPAWEGRADAWYLDGFSPACNPELWGPELMAGVFAHTAPGGTFATYTAAGDVRRGLEHAGFHVSKIPGYGRKRDSLAGFRDTAAHGT